MHGILAATTTHRGRKIPHAPALGALLPFKGLDLADLSWGDDHETPAKHGVSGRLRSFHW
jgi:hypothetical protein